MSQRVSRWKAQHVGCQKAVDNVKADLAAEIERLTAALAKQLAITCWECSEVFTETFQRLSEQPGDVVSAPMLCEDCGH